MFPVGGHGPGSWASRVDGDGAFLFVLALGLAFAWRKGALSWE